MARMLHRPGSPAGGQKAYLATPAYQGVSAGYAWALAASAAALTRAGIGFETAIFSGDCHVDDARNRLVRDFLEGDCTDLVFLDADMRWEPRDLLKLLAYGDEYDIVGASYPLKQTEAGFPVLWNDAPELIPDENGLLAVEGLPTGFLMIRRRVLEHLATHAPKFMPKSDRRSPLPLIFERTLEGQQRYGGDYSFCRKARKLGYTIHCDPEIPLEHEGTKEWSGSLGHWLRVNNIGALKAAQIEIEAGIETPRTFEDLYDAWNNPWAAQTDFLALCTTLAREAKGPIIECGSGLTTVCMHATGAKIHALENNYDHASALQRIGVPVLFRSLASGWYDIEKSLRRHYALCVIDGPARDAGNRAGILKSGITADLYLMDDMNSPTSMEIAEALGEVTVMGTERRYAIIKAHRKEAAA